MPYKRKCKVCKREIWQTGDMIKVTDYWLCFDCFVKLIREKSK